MANSSPPKRATASWGRTLRFKTLGDFEQQLVAGGVTEGVVYLFEAVQVEEDDGKATVGTALQASEGEAHAIKEERAIGQAGEVVVERRVLQAGFFLLLPADVAIGDEHAIHALAQAHARDPQGHVYQHAVTCAADCLHFRMALRVDQVHKHFALVHPAVGDEHFHRVLADGRDRGCSRKAE